MGLLTWTQAKDNQTYDDSDLLAVLVSNQNPDGTPYALHVEGSSVSKGNKKLAVSGSTALSSVAGGIPAGATKALLRPDAAMTLNDDGSAADANDFPLDANVTWGYDGDQLAAVKFFGTGNVFVWFYA